MTPQTPASPTSEVSSPAQPVLNITVTPRGLEALKRSEKEIAMYCRELPRLLAEGEAGRYALIRGDQLVSIWDTESDAIQTGSEKFGLEPFYVKKIDARDPERFAVLDVWREAQCPT